MADATTPDTKPQALRQSGLQESLRARAHDFIWAGIVLLLPEEDDDVNIQELQKKSTAELRDIYNDLMKKNIKRFESRTEAERRTAAALAEANQWKGEMPDGKKAAAATKATATKTEAKPTSKPTKGTKAAKGTKPARSHRLPAIMRGRPRGNPSYRVKKADAKMNEGSARTKVFKFVQEKAKGKAGIDRESIENHFVSDEAINVKASLDYLVKVDILELVQES